MPTGDLTYQPADAPYTFTWDGGDYIEMYVPDRADPAAILDAGGIAHTQAALKTRVDQWRETHC